MGVLGLAKKDLLRPDAAKKLDELSCRQLAFSMSGVHEGLTAYDIYEIGGELEPRLMAASSNSRILQTGTCLVSDARKA